MVRVLHVFRYLLRGGSETFALNIHRNIDRSKVQFDYMIHEPERQEYEDEIESLGGKVWRAPMCGVLSYFKYRKFWDKFLTEHPEYQIIHGHFNNHAAVYLSEAKKHGRVAVIHSHSTKFPMKSWKDIRWRMAIYPIRYIADYFFACSKQAGIDRFGPNVNVRFISNGIDTARYTFNPETRKAIRASRGVISDDTIVIGHVGNLQPVKNHKLLVEVFGKFHERHPNSKLWLLGKNVGINGTEQDIRKQTHELGLDDAVEFHRFGQ